MMDSRTAGEIVEKLGRSMALSGKSVQFSGKGYKIPEIARNSFRKIDDTSGSQRICFIDGGNNTIVESASFCLQAVRVYHAIYCRNRREKSGKKDFFVLASGSSSSFGIDVFGSEQKFRSFGAFDSTLSDGGSRVSPPAVCNACRKIAELREALLLAEHLNPGDIIVLDRDLEASATGEKEVLDEIYAKAERRNVIICGLSKTTRLVTETGDSAAAVVSSIAPEGEWFLAVAEADSDNHKAAVYFAKLHSSSKYVFRFEICARQKENAANALAALKQNAKDPVFVGYPYGLVEADRMARISNDEAEYMKVRLVAKAGKEGSKIAQYMKSVDAHSVLDNIS